MAAASVDAPSSTPSSAILPTMTRGKLWRLSPVPDPVLVRVKPVREPTPVDYTM